MDRPNVIADEYAEMKMELDATRKELNRLSGIEERFNHAVRDLEESKLAYNKMQQELSEYTSKYETLKRSYDELQAQYTYLSGKNDAYESFIIPSRLSH